MAGERQTTRLVEICRAMGSIWEEQGTTSYGGAFRYWAKTPADKWKMVLGINVAGERLHPLVGQLASLW